MIKSKKNKVQKKTRKNSKCVYTDEVYLIKNEIKIMKSKMKKTKKRLKTS
jgi:hypothetical protein